MSYDHWKTTEPEFCDQAQEERDFHASSESEWDRFDAELGAYNRGDTQSEWLLSDRDVWYRNPHFTGTPTKGHPEDDREETIEVYSEPPADEYEYEDRQEALRSMGRVMDDQPEDDEAWLQVACDREREQARRRNMVNSTNQTRAA